MVKTTNEISTSTNVVTDAGGAIAINLSSPDNAPHKGSTHWTSVSAKASTSA